MCSFPWLISYDTGHFWTMTVTYAAGLAAACAWKGVIVKGGATLEALGNIKTIVVDNLIASLRNETMEFVYSSKLCEGRCKVDACNDKYVESCELFLIHIFNLYGVTIHYNKPLVAKP